MSSFDEYKRPGEPDKKEKLGIWQTAIGLQDVDGLKPSAYLIETAKQNIDGKITINDVKERLNSYYKTRNERKDGDRTEEADKVSAHIAVNPQATQDQIAKAVNKSPRTVKTIMQGLQDKGFIKRKGSKKTGKWEKGYGF